MIDNLKRSSTILLDVDWLWRKGGPKAIKFCVTLWWGFRANLSSVLRKFYTDLEELIARHRKPDGILLRSWPTGNMALWVMIMLIFYLSIYYYNE